MPEKICLSPSSELTTVFGKIGRQASYIVCEDLRRGKVVLGCMPALFSKVREDIDFVTQYPVITLEGHQTHHAAKLVKKFSQNVSVEIDIEQLLRENNIDVSDSSPEKLGPDGEKAVKFLAEYTAKVVDKLLLCSRPGLEHSNF